jgi:hypothetical protein
MNVPFKPLSLPPPVIYSPRPVYSTLDSISTNRIPVPLTPTPPPPPFPYTNPPAHVYTSREPPITPKENSQRSEEDLNEEIGEVTNHKRTILLGWVGDDGDLNGSNSTSGDNLLAGDMGEETNTTSMKDTASRSVDGPSGIRKIGLGVKPKVR